MDTNDSQLTPEEERVRIREISIDSVTEGKEGDTFYLISHRWWQHWLDYVSQDLANASNDGASFYESVGSCTIKKPSGISNADLICDARLDDSNIELRDALVEGRDYILLPQRVWQQLYSWYGGGPTLPRKVISSGLSQELTVEVYLLRLQLLVMPKQAHTSIRISKKETIRELHMRACEMFDLDIEQISIWDYYGLQKHVLMNDMDGTLDDANIQMDQDILVEVLGEINDTSLAEASRAVVDNGFSEKELTSVLAVPNMSKGGVSRNSSSELASSVKEVDNSYGISGVVTRGVAAGLTGLLNLGNTCFMNSAIQCLVHTPEFARYFREDYHPDINVRNPLGMEGKLALAFGELLRKLWAPGRTPIAPRPFKANLARFAPQFSGYNQHDSQELLAFLLDGLHEDLNRVKDRPYVESRDANGRPDEEVADEYWANHIARNDSIIVDVCQGQYKSTLVCPVCGKFSVTFDPFMYLSLPLQTTNTRTMTVMVFTSDGSARPTPCTVTVPKQGRIRELVQSISNSCSLKFSEKVLLAEIRDHSVNRFLEDPLVLLTFIKDEDQIAAYKIQKFEKGTIFFQLVHRREENYHDAVPWKPFGIPLVSAISRDNVITRGDVHAIVRTMLSSLERSETLEPSNFLNTRISDTPVDKPRDVSSNEALNSNLSDSMDINHSSKIASPPKLPLNLVDENNICIDLSVGEEKTIKVPPSSTSVLVFIDWSKELLEKYETDFLEYLPEVFRYGHAKKARAEPLSLYTCLDAFLREEPLVPEDMWYCPQCKEQRQASKKLDLWRLPEVLVIHLKRFSYSRSMKHKLETYVNFPIHDFDLTNYVAHTNSSKRQLYELYALSNHFGGMGSGHYTANIKLLDENKWFNFDDSHISTMNEEDVKSAAAYVLFYRRAKSEDVSLNNGAQSSAGHNNIVSSKK